MKYNVQSLFPIPLYETILEELSIDDIIKDLSNNTFTEFEGYAHTKNDQLFLKPKFMELKNIIHKHVDTFMRDVFCYEYDSSYFTCSWINIQKPGSSHHRHYHPNSIVSGTLFIKLPPNSGHLVLFSPNQRDIVPKQKERATPNMYSIGSNFPVYAVEKKLVIFPSFIEHLVSKNESQEDRITISFNVFVKGFLGNSNSLTYCKL